ncbi:EPIDERMAL PATTERNING FACTOR-like protein 8 [Rhodamnia argentea]|uniref:Epidermal patterning factor-like protein n=1 Tax=Rhodamnia argentea TaxID=178133 RepID=A0A8B8NTP4_9MYRT|nr:EPIDERMAL PATTERNING FACTOR-like protein 8 [Rhodamnia argentea]
MDSSTGHSHALLVAATFIFVFSLTIPPLNSGESLKQGEMVLGSRPPDCVAKCFGCTPCLPTLVVAGYQKKHFGTPSLEDHSHNFRTEWFRTSPLHDEGNSYYLLSWRCRCGDKIFHP